ncbi:MAG TPA: prepilin-type N-terminal cleavage/methylation domain-containing protein [Actinomycetota bacterium]|nr:prepilin-type N-terminal cleavage/methylation domain-containing protein [Actinomycetota bacterium]
MNSSRVREQDGFTLIELMVVVLIIAILIAIAIPTFLGLRARAQDRSAMSDLRNGFIAVKAFYTDDESYAGFNAAEGEAIEPSLEWVDSDSPAVGLTGVAGVTATTVVLNRVSDSGTAFCLADDTASAGGIARGMGTAATYAACLALPDWRPG